MKTLFERIIAWGADKGLHDIEFNPLVQIGFLLEELHEVNKEFIAGNIDKAVGEICDLIVFAVNALVLLKAEPQKVVIRRYSDNSFIAIIKRIDTEKNAIIKSVWFNNGKPATATYINLIEECCNCIFSLGYSPELALEETVKKIESRQGKFNDKIGKWVKTATLYEPNYSLARLK